MAAKYIRQRLVRAFHRENSELLLSWVLLGVIGGEANATARGAQYRERVRECLLTVGQRERRPSGKMKGARTAVIRSKSSAITPSEMTPTSRQSHSPSLKTGWSIGPPDA